MYYLCKISIRSYNVQVDRKRRKGVAVVMIDDVMYDVTVIIYPQDGLCQLKGASTDHDFLHLRICTYLVVLHRETTTAFI